ncbi:NAD(P)-binding protein [Hymenopellis radicata]|nr:NAD(P)-binding protein [Hymenopellis radicata]
MRVLVLGATGTIGFPVAQALVRAGHQVYGMTRSESKAKKLIAEEISPIIGEVSLDCVVDTVGGDAGGLITALADACTNLRPAFPKLSYIYTSGTWVHGENRESVVTDTTPITPSRLVNPTLNGIVIRPSLLYGRGASLLAPLFEAASKGGEIEWPGTPGVRWASAPALGGKIFDAANDTTESEEDVLTKLVKISGASGYRLKKPDTVFERALCQTSLVRPYLGRALLGWQPKKIGLVDGLATYYASWKASL